MVLCADLNKHTLAKDEAFPTQPQPQELSNKTPLDGARAPPMEHSGFSCSVFSPPFTDDAHTHKARVPFRGQSIGAADSGVAERRYF